MNKYSIGETIETKYFYKGSHGKNIYKLGKIIRISEDNYYVEFYDDLNPRRISKGNLELLSKKFDPGSGKPKKFKFLT